MHEVSMRKCTRITCFVEWVGVEESELPTYEGLPNLAYFWTEFEEKVTEHQCMSAQDFMLKVTPARWWVTHKESISKWPQCRQLMEL